MADGNIAPLGFAIDTGGLLTAKQAAEQAAESFKVVGTSAGQAQQATAGMAQGMSADAQKLKQTADAAEALAKANKAVSDSAKQALVDQNNLANAPKPVAASAVSPVIMPSAPQPVQAKSGGWYADQAMADWADGQAAKRAAASAAEQAAVRAANVRASPVAAIGAGITGNAIAGAAGAGGGGITDALEDTADAADAADGAMGRVAGRAGMLGVVGAAVGAALGAGLVMVLKAAGESAIKTADETELLERRLESITGTSDRAARAIEGVSRAARGSGSEIGDQRALRLGLERAPINSGPGSMDTFGSSMAQIDQIGGGRAAEFDQLGSKITAAFKDGRVELNELNTLLDQSPELASKLSDGLGMPIEAIKRMAAEGRLFADDFVAGINRVSGETQAEFNAMERTAEASFTEMGAAASEFWESLSNSSGLSTFASNITSAVVQGFRNAKTIIDNDGVVAYLATAGNVGAEGVRAAQIEREQRDQANAPGPPPRTIAPWQGQRHITGHFGESRDGGSRTHGGVDVRMDVGTPIYATGEGNFIWQRSGCAGGNRVRVGYDNGATDDYMHLSRVAPGLDFGDRVREGQLLGYSGNSGRSTAPHLHWQRNVGGRFVNPMEGNPGQNPGDSTLNARAGELMTTGGTVEIARLEGDLNALRAQPQSAERDAAIAQTESRLRSARAAQARLGDTALSRAQDSAADQARGRELGGGGGGLAIGTAAARSYRASTEAGYTDATEQDFLNLGITGAVEASRGTTDRISMQADAEQRRTAAAGRSRVDMDAARIEEQVQQFQFQNFGSLEDGKITAAVNSYREALERLNAAQRATANAQELLNAQTQAGIEDATGAALASGARGYAVDLARQVAEEAAIARDGGSVEASRTRFDARNRGRAADAAAQSADEIASAGRYASIGSDAFSRREFGRAEEERRAVEQSSDPEAARGQVRARQAAEDAQIAKDRRDADTEGMRVAERQLELQGLVGRSRREALAVMERENELVAQGLLPAGGRLLESEEASVRANAERLRLIQEQVQTMQEIDAIAGNTADAVGGGARSLLADLFDDGKVEAEKFISVIQGVVSRIGTNIADVLLVRPLERATERFADQAVDWAMDAFGGRQQGGGGAGKAAASGVAGQVGEIARAAAVTSARTAGEAKALIVTQTATSAMASLTKSALMASAALTAVGGGDVGKGVGAAIAGAVGKGASGPGPVKGAAFGDSFGGIGSTPTLFNMAGGMGLAFEAGPEAVLPLKRGPDGRLGVAGGGGDGGGVMIQVNDYRSGGAAVETQETSGPDGRRVISMTIRDEMKAATREGAMDGPLRDTYGVTRTLSRR